jgi:DNA repair protein RecO (recombination protein O)
MRYKTYGIVLSNIKYRETSIIVRILTEKFGLQSYIVNGVRSAKAKGKISLYQPLTLLDLVVYHKGDGRMSRISELHCAHPYQSIPYAFKKTTIAIFLSEVLEKVVREEEENNEQFQFLYSALRMFDEKREGFENFHLQLLLKLTQYLGIYPNSPEDFYRDTNTSLRGNEDIARNISQLIEEDFDFTFQISGAHRKALLMQTLEFYKTHIDGFGELRSLEILQEIMH